MPPMDPPASGVKVRMYRQGHGDCFLLAFRKTNGDPFYMLIDCGMKRGSDLPTGKDIKDVVQDIKDSTGKHIHAVVVTHEHDDHVSGFNDAKDIFDGIDIDRIWLAWTENPSDKFANKLRKKYKDTLIALAFAGKKLMASEGKAERHAGEQIRDLLSFASESDDPLAIEGITNKRAIKYVKDKSQEEPLYLKPHEVPVVLPLVGGIKIFVLGPPRNEKLLKDMDPKEGEGFEITDSLDEDQALLAAIRQNAMLKDEMITDSEAEYHQPFAPRYRIPEDLAGDTPYAGFFQKYYGIKKTAPEDPWRRIDDDWLRVAELLALRMSDYTNNTSLVLAIELPISKKVLLFTGDAQRGNWASWHKKEWPVTNSQSPGTTIKAEDLLHRTVFYKVGHHGSHNATLKTGGLDIMALGEYEKDFVSMIPANREWAYGKKNPWAHPLDSIYDELIEKSKGRVFMISNDSVKKPDGVSDNLWAAFTKASAETELYCEYTVLDQGN